MKIKMLSPITSWKNYRNLEAGKIYEMLPEDAQRLIQGGQAAEVIEEFMGEGVRKRVEAETKRPESEEKKIKLTDFAPEKLEEPPPPQKPETKPKSEEKRATKEIKIDSILADWLIRHGFIRNPEGIAYSKIVKVVKDE